LLSLFSCALATAHPALADPATAGTLVAPSLPGLDEFGPSACSDGAGGAYVAFKTRDGAYHVARLDAGAAPILSWHPVSVFGPSFDADAVTNVVSFEPDRALMVADNTHHNSYLTLKMNAAGLTAPDTNVYLPIFTFAISILPRSGGGAIAVSPNMCCSNPPTTRLLEIVCIGANGEQTAARTLSVPGQWLYPDQPRPAMASDDAGGAWILAEATEAVQPGTGVDLIITRVAADGTPQLGADALVLSAAVRDQREGVLAPDGSHGVFAVWSDVRNLATADDIYAMRLGPDGTRAPGWPSTGKPLASATGVQAQPAIAPDGSGGAWVVWLDTRSGEADLYFTHLLANGSTAAGFPANGRPLCAAGGSQTAVRIAPDGSGGFFAVWQDARNGEFDLFAQHIHATGVVMPGWEPDGVAICTDPTLQQWPGLLRLDSGRVLATWTDSRSGVTQVYATLLPEDAAVTGASGIPAGTFAVRALSNPASDAIEFSLSSAGSANVELALVDLSGRVVQRRSLAGPLAGTSVRFDTAALPPGLYFARATRAGVSTSTRVSLVH
jgi:hypothetical protein